MRYSHYFLLFSIGILAEEFITVTISRTDTLAARGASSQAACNTDPGDGLPTICTKDYGAFTSTSDVSKASSSAQPHTTAAPKLTCSMHNQDPDEGVTSAYCVCNGSKTLPLLSVNPKSLTIFSQSCEYTAIPDGSMIHPTTALGPATTNSAMCMVCSRAVVNEDSCTTMPNCIPEKAAATVQAGSSPVHVGTLTGAALYTSVSSALEKICPEVTQTTDKTVCATDSVSIGKVPYVEAGFLADDGALEVKVESSSYNATSLRDAMIHSAALTAQHSATGKNCYNQTYMVEQLKKRSLWQAITSPVRRLVGRDHPYATEEKATFCNAVQFAGVQYFSPLWRLAPQPGATDYIDASWSFHVGAGGDFLCDFLGDLEEALAVVAPEFVVGEVELGEEIKALCRAALGED